MCSVSDETSAIPFSRDKQHHLFHQKGKSMHAHSMYQVLGPQGPAGPRGPQPGAVRSACPMAPWSQSWTWWETACTSGRSQERVATCGALPMEKRGLERQLFGVAPMVRGKCPECG